MSGYVELHAKSFYSFGAGASHLHELLAKAVEYEYPALALTDANLCGALEFDRQANGLGIRPITGGELTLSDGSRVVLLARTSRTIAKSEKEVYKGKAGKRDGSVLIWRLRNLCSSAWSRCRTPEGPEGSDIPFKPFCV